ncbi:ABC transporter ATP-binding protein [Massilia agilis]
MTSGVRIQDLHKAYAGHGSGHAKPVFSGLDLEIRAGELVALVGPSGCGKSTLLNLIAGLEAPSRGQVGFDRPAGDVKLGVVFQQPRLLDWLSVAENISIVTGGQAKGVPPDVAALLAKVELLEHAHSYPQFLSGGQKQRAAIARAFAVQPDVLLLDEPFSALDELTARRVRSMLQSLWMDDTRARPTGVLVTHNMLEAAFLADRIVLLGGSPAQVVQTITVDIARPRDPDDPALFEIHREVMAALHA